MDRLKVLALVTRLPVPPWRGDQVRSFHHLRLLAARHDVTVCAIVLGRADARHAEAVRALGMRLEVVELGLVEAGLSLARVLVGDPRPLQVLLYARWRAMDRVAALLARERFDVVHAQLVRTAALWPPPGRPGVVLDLVDVLSANFERRARRDRGLLAWVSGLEARRLRATEEALARAAVATLVVSEPERAHLPLPGVRVVPNGVDLSAFPLRTGDGVPGRIVFAGNLGYFPNVDAARWLATEILPAVRARVPAATLHLAGARPGRAVRALATLDGVTLAADVPQMAPEVASGAVTVIPMRSGSGLQNKVLEAMAVGTPVVTTPQVAAALDVVAGEHLVLGEDTESLARAAGDLLAAPERARAVARAGRRLVEERYRWEVSAQAVEAAWYAAAGSK
ncbi:MAG TPA: glycosyltransferase [Candidatus Eisenbacteria bacterium]|nr:glycosyltransferase [Candidatus Eisenbacteria bacterium]